MLRVKIIWFVVEVVFVLFVDGFLIVYFGWVWFMSIVEVVFVEEDKCDGGVFRVGVLLGIYGFFEFFRWRSFWVVVFYDVCFLI